MDGDVHETLRKLRAVVVPLVVAAIVAVVVWQVYHLKSKAAADGGAGDTTSGLTLYQGAKGISVPKIEGRTIDRQRLSVVDLRGHVVVLNVWGSWCAPCRAEAPDLASISAETAPRGVRFVGIDVRDNLSAARAFVRRYQISYPSYDDQDGLVLGQFTGIIPVSAVPSTLVVDRAGVVRARVVGRVDATTLRGLIEDVEKIG